MLGPKGILPPLIPDCYVLCTLAILKNIRNPLIFLWKMATYSCFWRVKRSKILLQASLHQLSDLLTLVSFHIIIRNPVSQISSEYADGIWRRISKKERYQCISRYHQNIRSYVGIIQIRYMGRSSELPLSLSNKLPVSFTKFSIVRLGKNVNINIKIYPVIFWSLIFWSQMQVSRTNCILQECFREAVICFCNAEYGKMHKKQSIL